MRDSIHQVADKLEKQARRASKKFQTTRRKADRHTQEELWSEAVVESGEVAAGEPRRIIETNSLNVKPMTADEAALQLENDGSDFIVFRDGENGDLNVLYRRRDGNYGLVTPGA